MTSKIQWKGIVIHHSLTEDNESVSWEAIRKYHIETNGWQDIGYNFGIEYGKGNEVILEEGRSLDIPGAHTKGFNHTHIGICVVGNYDKMTLEPDKESVLLDMIHILIKDYDIKVADIIGHWESFILLNQAPNKLEAQLIKSCPGRLFDLDNLRNKIKDKIS